MNKAKEQMFKDIILTLEKSDKIGEKGITFKKLKDLEPIKSNIDKGNYTSNSLIATMSSAKYNDTQNNETCLFKKFENDDKLKVVSLRENYKQVKLYQDLFKQENNN